MTNVTNNNIVFQGEQGANSHIACQAVFPDMTPVPCRTFEDTLTAVSSGTAQLGMIPIENSLAGRVADIHHLMPRSDLFIVGEHFLKVHHQLLTLPNAPVEKLKSVQSHEQALSQCRDIIQEMDLEPIPAADTAGSAREIAEKGDKSCAAIATELAASLYGLQIVRTNIEDASHNTTRFIIVANQPNKANVTDGPIITSLVFQVRNVPAALYKALGGFATNGVNITKLESYQLEGSFNATQFYADIEGHPEDRSVQLALEDLSFFTSRLRILGVYKASPLRQEFSS
ncbi:MAG: prephenate dehydratase [Parvularculales bacterium]